MWRLIAVGLALFAAPPLDLRCEPKKSAPVELTLVDLDGKKVRLRDYRGKIVVLNFWATWCGACKDEMPMFVEVEKEWASKGIVFIGASLDDRASRNKITAFLKTFQVDFPVWKGATLDDLSKLKMGEAVPCTAFLDEQGHIFARVQGEIKRTELIERLAWVTSDRKAPAPQALLRNL